MAVGSTLTHERDNDASDADVAELRRLDQPDEADGAVALKTFLHFPW
jgi:hypothetical protein